MINYLAKNQNWAKVTPWAGLFIWVLLFTNFSIMDPHFWGLINIPLYLFHQTEEHYIPGGFKQFMNKVIMDLPEAQKKLTDIKIFWINIIMVWLAFAIFGILSFVDIGFGLLIIIFSIMNCLTHIAEAIKLKSWNPGLVMASIQFVISIFAAVYVTVYGLDNPVMWWSGTIIFSVITHILLFKLVMTRD